MVHEVLVIDDDEGVITLLKSIFTRLGYEVTAAYGGEKGLEIFNGNRNFDMVVTDINMPGMDGNEVARSIRSSDKADVPIIAMSGYDYEVDRGLFTLSINKPFRLQAFMDMIKSIDGRGQAVQSSHPDWKCYA